MHTVELFKEICKNNITIQEYYKSRGTKIPVGLTDGCEKIGIEHLKDLFNTRKILAELRDDKSQDSDYYNDFINLINRNNYTQEHVKSNLLVQAHALFVETASYIPYTGMLPTALDKTSGHITNAHDGTAFSISFKKLSNGDCKYSANPYPKITGSAYF